MTSKTNSDMALGDVRSTSADMNYFFTEGFTGSLEDAAEQARAMPVFCVGKPARQELLEFLRCAQAETSMGNQHFDRRNTEAERDSLLPPEPPQEPGFYTLEYALKHFPNNFAIQPAPGYVDAPGVGDRLDALTDSQMQIYWLARLTHGVRKSLEIAEHYPYPAAQS